jgi:hypothetical protein
LLQTSTSTSSSAAVATLSPYELPLAQQTLTPTTSTAFTGHWISPHIPLLAVAFDRYRMHSLAFHYEPQSTTVVDDRLVFAWTDDPSHPFLAPSSVSGPTPSQLEQLVTQDSVAFAPWKSWTLTVPVAKDPRFLYQTDLTASGIRLADIGSFSCVGSAAPTTPIQYGILYADFCIEFFDPVPIVQDVTVFTLARKRPSRRQVVEEKKEDEKWDEISPSPPTFRPNPSSAPGAPLHVTTQSEPPPKPSSRK